jgi:peptide/nickel transport system permease protein
MLGGIVVIVFFTFLALFAYLIIPDDTTNANFQMPEVPLKKAGYTVDVFTLTKEHSQESLFIKLWRGNQYASQLIAYDSFEVNNNTAVFHTPLGFQKIITLDSLVTDGQQFIYQNTTQKTFLLGTDKFGRDILSRLILGVRISLIAGFMAVLVSLLVGLFLGSLAGYFRGWMDQFVMYIINVTWSIPTILLVFAIVLAFGRGLGVIFLAVGLTMWVDVARIVRGQVISIKEEQYITAAQSIGQSTFKIIIKHILPNIAGPVLVIISANFATAILIEAGLSYLGFGVNPPAPSLGNMLNENYGYALSGNILIAVLPALFIMLLVLSFNLIGSGLRDLYDVKNK